MNDSFSSLHSTHWRAFRRLPQSLAYLPTVALWMLITSVLAHAASAPPPAPGPEPQEASAEADWKEGKARILIEANLGKTRPHSERVLFVTQIRHWLRIDSEKQKHVVQIMCDVLEGETKEFVLPLRGQARITSVNGDRLQDWSVREGVQGARSLVLRSRSEETPTRSFQVQIEADSTNPVGNPVPISLAFESAFPGLFGGFLKIQSAPAIHVQTSATEGLVPIESTFLPVTWKTGSEGSNEEVLAFRLEGNRYSLTISAIPSDPEARSVSLRDFGLRGKLFGDYATFLLTAKAHVRNPNGATLPILSGQAALDAWDAAKAPFRCEFTNHEFVLRFDKPGEFEVQIPFRVRVERDGTWNRIRFQVARAPLLPMNFEGLEAGVDLDWGNASQPERQGNILKSFLPGDGSVSLSWKGGVNPTSAKLFFAAEMISQWNISPGLARQEAWFNGHIMQGELKELTLQFKGPGTLTSVQGPDVLAWNLGPPDSHGDRLLQIQFNQVQRETFALQLQTQAELGAFPTSFEMTQMIPEGATRFSGFVRVVNQGAVRLEITQSAGYTQLSPDQFPETDATRLGLNPSSTQRFVYRFSGSGVSMRLSADSIRPELTISETLVYRLGETQREIRGDFDLEIREAPLRELNIRIPKGYAVSKLTTQDLADYFLRDLNDSTNAELRVLFSKPIAEHHTLQLNLERVGDTNGTDWNLPRVEILSAKATRGHVGVAADAGFRISPDRTSGMTDIATAFFPQSLPGLQSAFRLTDSNWAAIFKIERQSQSLHVEALHLFSIGEGIAYGSSTLHYLISGAPVSSFLVELNEEFSNVEFSGKDVRNWQKTTNGYRIQLNTPASGPYTLLATCERPFKSQGDTLSFTGARPVDVQSDQGYTLLVSAYQFQVRPVTVSQGLLELETAEVPQEYRLFFDAPILKAYRYTSRPFNLQIALSPLQQGETLTMIVDRATLSTRISKEGEWITDARYFVKNRGNTHLRIQLPPQTKLWTSIVNSNSVVPVEDGTASLIPMPPASDPNAVQTVDLKFASRSSNAIHLKLQAPILQAPVLLAEWQMNPDEGQRLEYVRGTLTPIEGFLDTSGFAELTRFLRHRDSVIPFTLILILIALGSGAWFWATTGNPGPSRLRWMGGMCLGTLAFLIACLTLPDLFRALSHLHSAPLNTVRFLAPVQQSGSALNVELQNRSDQWRTFQGAATAWPALVGILVWLWAWRSQRGSARRFGALAGWFLLVWAALRAPFGLPPALIVLAVCGGYCFLIPLLRRWYHLSPQRTSAEPLTSPSPGAALWILGAWCLGNLHGTSAHAESAKAIPAPLALVIAQESRESLRVDHEFVFGTTRLKWNAQRLQTLPLLIEPAVVTAIEYPSASLRLLAADPIQKRPLQLFAEKDGLFEIEMHFQLRLTTRAGQTGFVLPTPAAMLHTLQLELPKQEVEIVSPEAVSIEQSFLAEQGTTANVFLPPSKSGWIGWHPRNRDTSKETQVFFAELHQLFIPSSGIIDGFHEVRIKPSHGEVTELLIEVAPEFTIVDVTDGEPTISSKTAEPAAPSTSASRVSLWRYDPTSRALRIALKQPESRPFRLLVHSQRTTGSLPGEYSVQALRVRDAAEQHSALGFATGQEVQLDSVTAEPLSPLNLEDFSKPLLDTLAGRYPGLALRRAFRSSDTIPDIHLRVSAVEPDIRIETEQTVSLGEDRTLLAAHVSLNISRAGIFSIRFALPPSFDVEAASGKALSHWTELKTEEGRMVTLHLKGKTVGAETLDLTLVGPGAKAGPGYAVPQLVFREATKQIGQLVLVPEMGLRLQMGRREGVVPLDPQKAGIREKNVLAFRILEKTWRLDLDIEPVEAWVQVNGLQEFNIGDAQVRASATLQFQIENAGLRNLRLTVPTNAENLRIVGDQVVDFAPIPTGPTTQGVQAWDVKLRRRIVGKYALQVQWQVPLSESSKALSLQGVQALDASLQRGFVSVHSIGRLQLLAKGAVIGLQPTEWQSIPRTLLQHAQSTSASLAYRLVEPAFQLPLRLERHETTKVLPAHVNQVTLASVISDEGVMLTHVTLELIPGDKRLLQFTPPSAAEFWFAQVNQNGVWPWRDQQSLLIPLEQQSQSDKPTTVELYYSSKIGNPGDRRLDLKLEGPRFDLPLENITWQVYLNDKWELKKSSGNLQLREDQYLASPTRVDVQSYLLSEASANQRKSQEAEAMLHLGSQLLDQGNPQQARWAFQNALGLSVHDDAFNEDARVQLHNLKVQQALVGLNVIRPNAPSEAGALPGWIQDLKSRRELNYSQKEAKQWFDGNTPDDNAALTKLAERIVQQQDAAMSAPVSLRASLPRQGRMLTFLRTVQIDPTSNLSLTLQAAAKQSAPPVTRLAILAIIALVLGLLARISKKLHPIQGN